MLLGFLWMALNVQLTDADLSDEEVITGNKATATTLDLGTKSTINRATTNLLFQTVGLAPGGFDVRSLKIKNDGKVKFSYEVKFERIGGTPEACGQLSMVWFTPKGQKKWEGKVSQLALNYQLPESGEEDLIMTLEREETGGNYGNCQFDLVFKTIRPNQGESGGFRDEERLTNLITFGN